MPSCAFPFAHDSKQNTIFRCAGGRRRETASSSSEAGSGREHYAFFVNESVYRGPHKHRQLSRKGKTRLASLLIEYDCFWKGASRRKILQVKLGTYRGWRRRAPLGVVERSCAVAVIQNAENGAWVQCMINSMGREHVESHAYRKCLPRSPFPLILAAENRGTRPCLRCLTTQKHHKAHKNHG